MDPGVGPEAFVAPAVPVDVITGSVGEGCTVVTAPLALFVTVRIILMVSPAPTDSGVAEIETASAFLGHVGYPPSRVNVQPPFCATVLESIVSANTTTVLLGMGLLFVPVTTTLNT